MPRAFSTKRPPCGSGEHDVKGPEEGVLLEAVAWLELDDDAVALALVTDAVEDAVARVQRLARDIQLSDERLATRRRYGEVNVRRAAGIGDRLYGAESVSALGIGQHAPAPLEGGVALFEKVTVI